MPRKTTSTPQQSTAHETLKQSEERYKAFIAQSTEGIWRFELEKPLSIKWPVKKQLDHTFTYAYLAECNDAMAKMYGYTKAEEIIGARLTDMLIPSDPNNVEYIKTFITSNYKLNDMETREIDKHGNIHIFENNLVGIVENGFVSRAWGTQRDITKQKLEEERQAFLEKVNNKLVSSLDHHVTLKEIAQLIVPYLADYCRIAVVDSNNSIKEIAVNHKDPTKVTLAQDLYESYKDLPQSTYGIPTLLRKGKPELIPEITDKLLVKHKTTPEVIKIVKQIGLKSYMGVPLIARNKIIGAMTFSSVQEDRFYTKKDLQFVTELAHRIALTLDNIRLFKEAQEELREREQIAVNLQKEEERLRLAQEAGHLGVFDWDMLKDQVQWSTELEKIYGIKQGGLKRSYNAFNDMIHPEDKKLTAKTFNDKLKTTDNVELEFRIIRPDGSIRWIYSKAQVFFDEKRRPIRSVGINIDITERMQQQVNLRFLAEAGKILGSSLNYETTLSQVAKLAVPQVADWFGIDILDEKGNLKQIAVGHKDPTKIKWAREMRKKYPPDMNSPRGLPYVLKTGKSELYPFITEQMLEMTARDKEHLKYIKEIGLTSVMIVPLFAEKKPIGAITFVSSETKRQFTKEDLAIAEELAHRASLAIENAKLYKSAQDAITLRDDFISVASHELKTPITSVKIFTQVLLKHAELNSDEKAIKSLNKMDKQVDKLTELVYNLLNIAKIQSGRMEFSKKTFDFDQMVHESVDVLQHMTTKHQLIIVGKTNKTFTGDEDRIGQVLSNLISNAIKYSPQAEKVVITLTAKNDQIGVAVQDYGIGMAKQHLNKIFNRFYRVSGATDKTFPGLGIGLYISDEIIKRHGGKLWAESKPGKGSTFFISLPLSQKETSEVLPHTL